MRFYVIKMLQELLSGGFRDCKLGSRQELSDEIEAPFGVGILCDFGVEIGEGSPKSRKEIYQGLVMQDAVNDLVERIYQDQNIPPHPAPVPPIV